MACEGELSPRFMIGRLDNIFSLINYTELYNKQSTFLAFPILLSILFFLCVKAGSIERKYNWICSYRKSLHLLLMGTLLNIAVVPMKSPLEIQIFFFSSKRLVVKERMMINGRLSR
ncbi:hypothetical protein BCR41DRAFT_45915 [Lobosporangium transversale]|uniref:Uncharacterized protein n=1 Tax=Lobosporangium transversale TaxID=64571 RepID=A0A1Y2GPZ4_9FUNG|nr:hypothetical protein BCR41DRAFT_45915 [Lobosporangium transversale]ORZ18352.1 hypothetical protein BCR41DRAFT_45915 [Lobosporangium transversale]|eukprot:XP_021882147.1 hypothetical protein BCR41DRAFT_45915 [Lobosporangium transversale]